MIAPDEFGGKSLARALHELCKASRGSVNQRPALLRDAAATVKIARVRHF
jgi:hypothetical protein